MELDRYDRQILAILQLEGRISNQDLADRIGLSPSPCLRRVRVLEESGLITGYRAMLDAKKLGLTLMALIGISMDQHTPERFANLEAAIGDIPEVLEYQFCIAQGNRSHGATGLGRFWWRSGCSRLVANALEDR